MEVLRKNNPKAMICWCFGILGNDLASTIKEGMEIYQKENQDENVRFIELPNTTEETVGARMHPGYYAHVKAADAIVDVLDKK